MNFRALISNFSKKNFQPHFALSKCCLPSVSSLTTLGILPIFHLVFILMYINTLLLAQDIKKFCVKSLEVKYFCIHEYFKDV